MLGAKQVFALNGEEYPALPREDRWLGIQLEVEGARRLSRLLTCAGAL